MEASLSEALRRQMQINLDSCQLYLQMAAWLRCRGLAGFAGCLEDHARKEAGHVTILLEYLRKRGLEVGVLEIRERTWGFSSLEDVMGKMLRRVRKITRNLTRTLDMAEMSAHADTRLLFAWLASVQLEEETMLLKLWERIAASKRGDDAPLSEIDRELSHREYIISELLRRQRRHGVA